MFQTCPSYPVAFTRRIMLLTVSDLLALMWKILIAAWIFHWTSKSEFGQENGPTRNQGACCKIEKGPRISTGAQGLLPFPLP